ncbi:Krueppel-like factor 2 [Penaeus monodon]|uniref:Krueppel-like factor 2 n=1 Tax=Penaeus monodon TaxID=6687 RepID=UPI0018A73CBD|nr:Krueppel-like factor 2 [Penaeus monodon]
MKGPVATLKPEEGPRFIGPDTPIDSWPSVYIKEELLEPADNNNSNSPDPLKTVGKVAIGEAHDDPGVTHTDLSDGEVRVEVSSSTNGAVAVNTSPSQHDSFLALCGDASDQPQDVCGDNGRVTPVDRDSKLSPAARNSPEFVSTYIQQLDNYPAAQAPPPQWYSYSSSQWAPYGYLPPAPPTAVYTANYYAPQPYPAGPQSPQQIYSGQHVTYYAAPPPPAFSHPGWGPPPHSPNPANAPSPTLPPHGSSGPLPPFSHPQRGSFTYSSPIYHPASTSHLDEAETHSVHTTHSGQTSHSTMHGQTSVSPHSSPAHTTHLPPLGHNAHLSAPHPASLPHHVTQSGTSMALNSVKCEPREVTSTSRNPDQGMPASTGRSSTRVFSSALEATCALCGVKFASSGHLKRHLQAHGANRRFRCHACDCAYSRQDNLRKHVAAAHENHNAAN